MYPSAMYVPLDPVIRLQVIIDVEEELVELVLVPISKVSLPSDQAPVA